MNTNKKETEWQLCKVTLITKMLYFPTNNAEFYINGAAVAQENDQFAIIPILMPLEEAKFEIFFDMVTDNYDVIIEYKTHLAELISCKVSLEDTSPKSSMKMLIVTPKISNTVGIWHALDWEI